VPLNSKCETGRKALTLYSAPPEQGTSDNPMLARLWWQVTGAAVTGELWCVGQVGLRSAFLLAMSSVVQGTSGQNRG